MRADGKTVLTGGHPTRAAYGPMPIASTCAVFTLGGQSAFFINDQRKFGRLTLVTTAGVGNDPFLTKLGPEPGTVAFTPQALRSGLTRHRSTPIKAALLDQSVVAGLGNIYTDECLHLARLDPRRPTASLTDRDVHLLHAAIRRVLNEAIERDGTRIAFDCEDQQHVDTYLDYARVFGKQGQPCLVCGTHIEHTRVAGRGTNYCPRCQQ